MQRISRVLKSVTVQQPKGGGRRFKARTLGKDNLVNTLNGLLKQSKENKNQTVAELCSITLSRLPTIVVERSELELQAQTSQCL